MVVMRIAAIVVNVIALFGLLILPFFLIVIGVETLHHLGSTYVVGGFILAVLLSISLKNLISCRRNDVRLTLLWVNAIVGLLVFIPLVTRMVSSSEQQSIMAPISVVLSIGPFLLNVLTFSSFKIIEYSVPYWANGKGYLYWGAFIMMSSLLWPILFVNSLPSGTKIELGADNPGTFKILANASTVGGVVSLGICVFWYRIARGRQRRNLSARIAAGIFFVLGSTTPWAFSINLAMFETGQRKALEFGLIPGSIIPLIHVVVFLIVVFLSIAYLLQFKKGLSDRKN